MAEANDLRRVELSEDCRQLPLKEVQQSTRKCLAIWLDPSASSFNKDYITQDWTGLAELMNFSPQMIKNFEMKNSPTIALFEEYETAEEATVGKLWDYLIELERYDIIEQQKIVNSLNRERIQYLKRQRDRPIQDYKISSPTPEPVEIPSSTSVILHEECIVTDDVVKGQKTHFDAFLSYCEADFKLAKELTDILEGRFGKKICLIPRDQLPGTSRNVTADIIAERCKIVLLLMTPEYIGSPEYEFQYQIAMTLAAGAASRFIVPVLLKEVTIPLPLRHLTPIDNRREDLKQWFWDRLRITLESPPLVPRYIQPKQLAQIEISLTTP